MGRYKINIARRKYTMSKKRNIPECPVEMTLQLIGDKWKVLIIRDLLTGTKRFSELMRSVTGITQKVLTSNLRSMEADGLVNRKVYPQVPPKVEYSLTETGLSLKPILDSMVQWGTEYRDKMHRSETSFL
ncbi:transcriptional regulator, HxlR family [Anaerostipes caccae L1-92]|jgi:DNA-binding HxlR family transcriptional regulator|uniref:Transcriptional regulator, HxlR family n=2 Tax=Anaerostipes caccae TaxID=105841 RepID=B0MEF4_ANACD|nr:transcriptional regulator, HxlR family [Anaerostipes caccae L1-92]